MNTKIATFIILITSSFLVAQNRYLDPVFDSISSKTFNYAIKNKDTLKLDVYEPINDSIEKRPLFVIVHGGGFNSGKRNDKSLISLAENIAKKGFVVTSIDYRLMAKNKSFGCNFPVKEKMEVYSNTADDLLSALEYLINYKDNFRIDAKKIILLGISAGAETVLNITYNRELVINNLERYADIKPAAIISVSGAVLNADLITKKNATPAAFYHGVDDKTIPYNRGPHQSCDLKRKGFLLIDGSKKIADKLEVLNSSFMLYSYLNQGHYNFDLPTDDIRQAYIFINKVIFQKKFYQSKITQ
ncbi:alpha/beta hydrolase [Mariniflexile sp.]|uniref:alpha/beta hydrolase n=2 Tax=Mariniflexile sp. TaxID=1979402 RepID=UPI004047B226